MTYDEGLAAYTDEESIFRLLAGAISRPPLWPSMALHGLPRPAMIRHDLP